MRHGTWRFAATLLALALPVPASALVAQPNDPNFPPMPGWQAKIGWEPPADNVQGAVIAIVDSGMWSGFDDFAGYLDDESADCVNKPITAARTMQSPSDIEDVDGHGTKVAALAAAPANGKGTVGVSPNSHVIIVRITLTGDSLNIACAFNYLATIAIDQPLVVNVSSVFGSAPPGAQAALDRLIAAGAVVVAAAGNDTGAVQWPARAQHVLAVGHDDGRGATGANLDLVAPGANLWLPTLESGKWTNTDQGTSFSSPIVAGAAARVWGPIVADNPQVVTYLLRKNARKNVGTKGFGLVNIASALTAGLKTLPVIDDVEPNDLRRTAQTRAGCTRTCKLRGLVTTTDDQSDYWFLRGRRKCPARRKATGGVATTCFAGRGGVYVRVRARKALGLYTVSIPRR